MGQSNGGLSALQIPREQRPSFGDYNLGAQSTRARRRSTLSGVQIEASEPRPLPESRSLPSETDEALLQRVHDTQARYEERKAALEELCEREVDGLDGVVLQELSREGVEARWRSCLVLVLAHVPVIAVELRERLTGLLLQEARRLRVSPEPDADPPLWAAVRTFGALAPIDRLHELREFLQPEDSGTTRQVAFQAVYCMLELQSAPETAEAAKLRERVSQLSQKYIDPDVLISAENTALAVTCFCAAVLLRTENATSLADALVALKRPRMVQRCTTLLESARRERGQRGIDVRDLDEFLLRLVGRSTDGG